MRCHSLVGVLLLLITVSVRAEVPRVVVSVAPVHSLVAAVMEGVGNPTLLIPVGATPHSYALRPSNARALSDAQVVFWVGEGLEPMLVRPLQSLAGDARQVELMDLPALTRLAAREGGEWGAAHDEGQHHGEAHHEHGDWDPHIWLSPQNAAVIVDAVSATLAAADPEHAARYQSNAQATRQRIRRTASDIAARLKPVQHHPYLVFHDAYQYFEQAFSFPALGAITVNPDQPPGARRLAELRDVVRRRGARCVFSEPQFRSAVANVVVEGTGARHGILDPIGSGIAPGPDLWFVLMERMATHMAQCLGH